MFTKGQLRGSHHRIRGTMQGGESAAQRDRGGPFRRGHPGGTRDRQFPQHDDDGRGQPREREAVAGTADHR